MSNYENDKWEFYEDKKGEWRWRRTAPNGNIVGASSEGYVRLIDCEANAIRHGYNDTDKWEFYQDAASEWRWRRTASNGEIVGASTEGYSNLTNCKENARRNRYIGD